VQIWDSLLWRGSYCGTILLCMTLRKSFNFFSSLVFSSLVLVGCNGTSTDAREAPAGDPTVAGLSEGQSGSEGSQLRLPCFFEQQSVFTVEITSVEGGCFEGTVQTLLSQGAKMSSFAVGDSLGGVMEVFYNSRVPSVGELVAIQYSSGQGAEPAALGGYVQVSPMNGNKVEVEWLGGTYEYTPAELLADTCRATIEALPNLVVEDNSGVDPNDGVAPVDTPLTCPSP